MSFESVSIVFPGQGSQRPGMGRDFHQQFAEARAAFEEASDAVGFDVARLCFDDDERLGRTEFAQPAIVATEIAMWRVLERHFGVRASAFGGHSLGEYSALVAAGAMNLADAVGLVHQRGRLMQSAVAPGRGRMSAVIGEDLDREVLEAATAGLEVTVANDNSTTQAVLSGLAPDTLRAERRVEATAAGPVRFVELDVSAPFHSRLMAPVESRFRPLLEAVASRIDACRASVVTSNFLGGFHAPETPTVIDNLVRQISATVRWRDNMKALVERSSEVFEVGPGRPLRGFFRTIGVEVCSITDLRSARRVGALVEAA
jgi:[acyl-carrier-protein] S-malonyltransferase